MAITFNPTTLSNLSNETTFLSELNTNFSELQTALAEATSDNGSTLSGDLDVNGNDLNNVGTLRTSALLVDGSEIPSLAEITAVSLSTLGVGQEWTDMSASRTKGTSYQNATGRTIAVVVGGGGSGGGQLQVSTDGATWVQVGTLPATSYLTNYFVVPPDHYYRVSGSGFSLWAELR